MDSQPVVLAGSSIRWASQQLDAPRRAASLALLSARERDRLDHTAPARRDEFLAGRMQLRELAAELTGRPVEQVTITATCPDCGGEHGAPFVDGSRLRVSLSRCALATVAVAAWNAAVGVDVEPYTADVTRLSGIRSVPHWTRVEAVLKADGRGLRVDPASVAIDNAIASIAGSSIRYRVYDLLIDPTLTASVAVAL